MQRLLLSLIFLCCSLSAYAVIETYQFANEDVRTRYSKFVSELRCPKCQNQNLADSNSPISADLRAELHRLLHEGYSDTEIVNFMVERYGEFILYRPPLNSQTVILWSAPVILLVIGVFVVFVLIRRRGKQIEVLSDELSDEEQRRLQQLLEKGKHKS